MKISELRQIINEEVRKAIRTELRDVLVESVSKHKPLEKVADTITVRNENTVNKAVSSIESVLQETAKNMSRTDYKEILGYQDLSTVYQPATAITEQPVGSVVSEGVDISSIIGKAKAVLDASVEKDKERHALSN